MDKTIPSSCFLGVIFITFLFSLDAKAQFSSWFGSSCPIPTVAIQSSIPIGPSGNSWKLVFNDEFNGTAVDRAKWETKFNNTDPIYSDRTRPQEGPVVFNDQNVTVGNGYATIQVREEAVPVPYYPASGRFTGGVLETKDIPGQRFNQGRFEISCRFPIDAQRQWIGHALWPAFWLIGGPCGTEEIDVFELNDSNMPYGVNPTSYYNEDKGRVLTTLHGIAGSIYDPNRNVTCDNCIGSTPRSSTFNTGYNNLIDGKFHTFAVEWEPACITWFIDGTAIKTHYRFYDSAGRALGCSVPAGQNFQHPMWPISDLQVIIDMKLGKEANGDPAGRAPANLDIDYVRVYQRISDNDPRNLCRVGVITGDSRICSSSQVTFGLDNLPTNSTVKQWSVNPAGAATIVGNSTGSTCVVAPVSGVTNFTVQAQLNTNSNCNNSILTKNVVVDYGPPTGASSGTFVQVGGSCYYDLQIPSNSTAASYSVVLSNGSTGVGYTNTSTGGRVNFGLIESGPATLTASITSTNSCGSTTSTLSNRIVPAPKSGCYSRLLATAIETDKTSQLRTYPNPVTGVLIVNLEPEIHASHAQLLTLQGKSIITLPVTRDHFSIVTTGLATGMYLLQVITETGPLYKRIQIEN